jgi:hypothetical protein
MRQAAVYVTGNGGFAYVCEDMAKPLRQILIAGTWSGAPGLLYLRHWMTSVSVP